ncbi:hypothetical protein PIB30_000872 [Stylosanthes scabra]|uniref:Uncharacterized protein n=1 Tax=Stylosanthes scabra TaxID=79078 RepID=A0ABU6R1L4_9FABA|nr:hypothetical protein [Stylosanthes scabra]
MGKETTMNVPHSTKGGSTVDGALDSEDVHGTATTVDKGMKKTDGQPSMVDMLTQLKELRQQNVETQGLVRAQTDQIEQLTSIVVTQGKLLNSILRGEVKFPSMEKFGQGFHQSPKKGFHHSKTRETKIMSTRSSGTKGKVDVEPICQRTRSKGKVHTGFHNEDYIKHPPAMRT